MLFEMNSDMSRLGTENCDNSQIAMALTFGGISKADNSMYLRSISIADMCINFNCGRD